VSRGRFHDTVADAARVPATRTGPDERDAWTWRETVYGGVRRFHLRPQEYATPLLARRLADKWLEIAPEIRGSVGPVHTAIRGFLTDLGRQVRDSGRDTDFDLPDLRRRHLDAWEAGLLGDQRTRGTDTAYQRAVHLFALLRRVDHDTPGVLREEVVARLERDTRLSHVRRGGEPEFAPQEAERLRDVARGVVKQALADCRDADSPRAPGADVIVALHVLLSLGTGEPPEVLRRLEIGDIVATAVPGTDDGLHHLDPADRLASLVRRRVVHSWCVRYVKARSAERYQQVYTRRDKQVFGPLSALITLTAGARRATGSSRLWLMDRYGAAVEPCWGRKTVSLRAWAARNLSGTDAGGGLSEPVVFRRLRKSVTTAEALADPAGYLRSGRRHGARTFFEHYSNSGVLRAQAGRILMQAIGERFDTAVAGPTVVTTAAQEVLAAGGDAPRPGPRHRGPTAGRPARHRDRRLPRPARLTTRHTRAAVPGGHHRRLLRLPERADHPRSPAGRAASARADRPRPGQQRRVLAATLETRPRVHHPSGPARLHRRRGHHRPRSSR
jgi:hypothetical protein